MYSIDLALISLRGEKTAPKMADTLLDLPNLLGTLLYTVGERLGENRIFGFPQKYHVKTTQDTTQMTFRAFQEKLGPVKFFHFY